MGKVVGTIAKVAVIAAIAYFAPPLAAKVAPALLGAKVGGAILASKLGATIAASAVGAGIGAAGGAVGIPGLDAKTGAFAGLVGGSGLFGAPQTSMQGALSNLGIGAKTSALSGIPTVGTAGAGGITGTTLAGGAGTAAGGLSVGAGTAAGGITGTTLGGSLGGAGTAAGGLSVGTAGMAPISASAGAGGGLLSNLPSGLKAVAPQLLAAGLVGSGMSAGMKAQQAELDKARASNSAFTQERFSQAQRLLGEADYFNPEYMGRQAGQAALIRGSIQETEGTRGLTGARRLAEQRRFRLGTSRNVGTAFQQGFGTGVDNRTRTRYAGIQSIPSSYPLTTAEAGNLEAQRIGERDSERAGVGLLLGQVLGVPPLGAPAALPG